MAEPVGMHMRLTPAEVDAARREAAESGQRLTDVLQQRSGLDPQQFLRVLASTLQFEPATVQELQRLRPAFDQLPFSEALQHQCLPMLDPQDGALQLVIGDPFDADLQSWAGHRIAARFAWRLACPADIAAYLARHEETLRAIDDLVPDQGGAPGAAAEVTDLSFRTISEDTSPVVKLVHSTVYDALKAGVSDIHLESTPLGLSVRYRVDGVLAPVVTLPGAELAQQVISRVKIMSELDIAERRIPQDGRFKVSAQGREVDFRVSIMPSIFGEDAVLRVLDKQALSDELDGLRLECLGFDESTLAAVRRLARQAYGMLLVTGPTGCGKTTTLYAAISEINDGQDKIVTIEDPVEYQLPQVLQIPVNEKKGLTFARGLRSILRHDPDKIMVGEIRDAETAQIAIQSALTGHLVFTTVHANGVFDVVARFVHMGVEPYSFVSSLNGIMAQRLLRVNCPSCAERVRPGAALLADSGLEPERAAAMEFRAGRGCAHCRGTGYKGRRAIGEVLALNDEIREAIVRREPLRDLREAAARSGTRFLRAIALEMAARGETTLEEVNRVTVVS